MNGISSGSWRKMRARNAVQIGAWRARRCRRDGGQLGDEVAGIGLAQDAGAQVDRAAGRAEQVRIAVPLLDACGNLAVAAGEVDDGGDGLGRAQLGRHLLGQAGASGADELARECPCQPGLVALPVACRSRAATGPIGRHSGRYRRARRPTPAPAHRGCSRRAACRSGRPSAARPAMAASNSASRSIGASATASSAASRSRYRQPHRWGLTPRHARSGVPLAPTVPSCRALARDHASHAPRPCSPSAAFTP